jgi:hypothetical protein
LASVVSVVGVGRWAALAFCAKCQLTLTSPASFRLRRYLQQWARATTLSFELSLETEIEALRTTVEEREEEIRQFEVWRAKVYIKEKDRAVAVLNRILHSQLHAAMKAWRENTAEITRIENVKNKVRGWAGGRGGGGAGGGESEVASAAIEGLGRRASESSAKRRASSKGVTLPPPTLV